MPELPEVETVRAGLEAHVVGRRIAAATVGSTRAARRSLGGAAHLEQVLPDAVVTADDAAVLVGTPQRIEGRDEVATFFNGSARAALPVFIGTRTGTAWFHLGDAKVVFDFTVDDGVVRAVTFRAAPEVLSTVVRRDLDHRRE